MKIKLDENIPWDLAAALEALGHDTHSVMSEGLLGSKDPQLLEVCLAEGRVFITQDLDFARTRQWFAEAGEFGLLILRLNNPSRTALISKVMEILQSPDILPFTGRLTIVSSTRIRQRALGTLLSTDDSD